MYLLYIWQYFDSKYIILKKLFSLKIQVVRINDVVVGIKVGGGVGHF